MLKKNKCKRKADDRTYNEAKGREIGRLVLEVVVEGLSVVGWVALAVGSHAEHGDGFRDFAEALEVGL